MHSINFVEFDDCIHMLSWDYSKPEPIMSYEIYEMSGVTLGPWMPVPFRLVPEATSVQTATVEPLTFPHYSVQTPFVLIPNIDEVQASYVDDVHISDVQYCRPSILSLDTDIYPSGVTSTHHSHMAPLGPLLGLVGVRASCGFVCGPLWCICGSFWGVTMAIFLVVHITL